EPPSALPIRKARQQVEHHAPSASDRESNSVTALGVDIALNCVADPRQPIRVESEIASIFWAHDVLPEIRRSTGTGSGASIDDLAVSRAAATSSADIIQSNVGGAP